MTVVKFKIPDRVYTKEELFGAINNLESFENIVVLINDNEAGVWMMTVNGTTAERMNWMLDRAKLLLHKAD